MPVFFCGTGVTVGHGPQPVTVGGSSGSSTLNLKMSLDSSGGGSESKSSHTRTRRWPARNGARNLPLDSLDRRARAGPGGPSPLSPGTHRDEPEGASNRDPGPPTGVRTSSESSWLRPGLTGAFKFTGRLQVHWQCNLTRTRKAHPS